MYMILSIKSTVCQHTYRYNMLPQFLTRKWCASVSVLTKDLAMHVTYVINLFPVTS